jgi:acid stress chaperone HdeB
MKKQLFAAVLMLAASHTSVKAEVIDLATVKCSELATMTESDGTFLFSWLLGYMGGKNDKTTMDLSAMESSGEEIGKYCATNPEVGVLTAAAEVLGE